MSIREGNIIYREYKFLRLAYTYLKVTRTIGEKFFQFNKIEGSIKIRQLLQTDYGSIRDTSELIVKVEECLQVIQVINDIFKFIEKRSREI